MYADADAAIGKVISAIPTNHELPDVLAKVSVIKTLYATQLYDTFSMARHINKIKDIDSMLRAGNRDAVDCIRKGHGIISKKNSREIDFYSFATKYCSFHNGRGYPIYDNLVAGLVSSALKGNRDLRNYADFSAAIDQLKTQYGLNLPSYKELDMGLWIYAKFLKNLRTPTKSSSERIFFINLSRILKEAGAEF